MNATQYLACAALCAVFCLTFGLHVAHVKKVGLRGFTEELIRKHGFDTSRAYYEAYFALTFSITITVGGGIGTVVFLSLCLKQSAI